MSGLGLSIRSGSVDDTRAVGAAFARSLPPGCTISLEGPLGAGKTEFVRGFCEALGVPEWVTSPTYTLCNEYATDDGRRIVHVDAFRLNAAAELDDLALEDRRDARGFVIVEWGDRVITALPGDVVRVRLESVPDHDDARRLHVRIPEGVTLAGSEPLGAWVEERT
jgi:tRNA threonylcarbamoyladenosine biosynthesis protein TsaE